MSTIERVKDVIEDLYFIGDLNLHPFLGQLNFLVGQMSKDKPTKSKDIRLEEFPFLANFMEKSFRSLIENFIQRSIYLKTSRVNCDYHCFDILKAEHLISKISDILTIVNLSKLCGDLVIDLDDQGLKISALLKRDNGLKKNKELILDKVKYLFAEKIITTFKIRESDVKNCAVLELNFDISYDNNTFYKIESFSGTGVDILLPNQIKNYEMDFNKFIELNDHSIFKITENLEIKKVRRPSIQQGEILHFHFLFRPISLIIPKRGTLYSIGNEDTGSGRNPSFFIDIFSSVS